MATFTITTDTNLDALTGKAGGDTYTVNGAVLTIDGHSRYDVNGSTAATIGSVTLSATLGGTVKIRADKTRLLAYGSGSGTVPTTGSIISQGSASGKLLGVYADFASAPKAGGVAMPATGYILLKQWNSTAFAAGALTGIAASVVADPVFGGYGRDGWIDLAFEEAKNMAFNRLNNQTDDVTVGADFYIGITTGSRASTYQLPANGNALYISGVQVETAPSSGVYKWWPVTTCPMTAYNIETTGVRSRQCFITNATALLRFGSDGTNTSGGGLPPSGCKIRMPNIVMQNANPAARTVNTYPILASRYYMYPLGSGRLRIKNVSSAHRGSAWTTPYQLSVRDSSICGPLIITQNAAPLDFDNVCISSPVDDAVANSSALALTSSTAGGVINNCVISLGNAIPAARTGITLTGSSNVMLTDTDIVSSGMGLCAVAVQITACDSIMMDGCSVIGGYFSFSQSTNVTVKNCPEVVKSSGAPQLIASNQNTITIATSCSNILLDNWTFPYDECLGKGVFASISGSSNIKIRNMGSYGNPISGRGSIALSSWTRSGAVATWTRTAHGFRVGDYTMVYNSSAGSSVNGMRTVTSVIDADTYTTTTTNSGTTAGVALVYRTWCSFAIQLTGSGSNYEFNNIFIEGAYSATISTLTTQSNLKAWNISGGIGSVATCAATDMLTHGVRSTLATPAATAAQYGQTFLDGAVIKIGPSTGAATWTRAAAVMTINSPGHNLEATSRVRLYNSSDAGTQPNQWRNCSPIDDDNFTVICNSLGALSGTLDWDVPTDMLTVFMNEESDVTSRYTVDAGTPAFTGAGALSAVTVGDQITWEMPDFLINYTGFPAIPPHSSLTETKATTGVYRWTYDIAKDGGAFTGTFKNLLFVPGTGTGTAAAFTVAMADTTGIAVGSNVWGAGIAQYAKVASVDSGTQLTLDKAHTATVSGDLLFGELPSETFTNTFKLRIRSLTVAANSAAQVYFNIALASNNTSRAKVYPPTVAVVTQSVTVDNGTSGSRIQVYDLTSSTELANEIVTTFPYTWTDDDAYVADREIRVRASYVTPSAANVFVDSVIGVASYADPALSLRLNPVADRVYALNGIDGSTVTGIVIDGVAARYKLSRSMTVQEIYNYATYTLFTSVGIAQYGQKLFATDRANYALYDRFIKNVSTGPTVPISLTGGWIVDGTTGLAATLFDTTGGSLFNAPDHIVPFATGSGVTPGDVVAIAGAVWDEALASHVTVGTAGKTVADIEANSDITVAGLR